jgi:hypothetical protein
MSLLALNWAEKQKVGSSSAKAVLLVLAKYANDEGFCWPSQETIAKATELSADTVQRWSAHLEKIRLLRRERRKSSGGRWSAYGYHLHLNVSVHHAATPGAVNVADQAAPGGTSEPQSPHRPGRTVRHELSIESSIESSAGPSAVCEHPLGDPGIRLRKRLGDKMYFAWFLEVAFVEASKDTIILSVAKKSSKTYIENNFVGQLLDCFRHNYPKIVCIKLIVRLDSDREKFP